MCAQSHIETKQKSDLPVLKIDVIEMFLSVSKSIIDVFIISNK